MKLIEFDNKEQMSQSASDLTKDLIDKKINSGKIFTLALSGGSSPVRFYELLTKQDIDWSLVKIFMVDERKVPADHKFSNFNMINTALLSKN
jgi:6-phosphogluconolactonase